MVIDPNGNVGIGTTSPDWSLHVKKSGAQAAVKIESDGIEGPFLELNSTVPGGHSYILQSGFSSPGNFRIVDATAEATRLMIDPTGNVGIGTIEPNFKLDVRGTIGNNGTSYHSDIRWKKSVESLNSSLGKILNLRGVQFEWRVDEFEDMNFKEGKHIGLIAQEVEEVIPELVTTGADGYKSVKYANLVAVLIEAVKEQEAIIQEQNAENAATKAEMDQTKAELSEMKSKMAQFESVLQKLVLATPAQRM